MAPGLSKAEQSQRTRLAILERARRLFATKGYAATGTEEIIRELGITRGALYHQFKDKLGVFEAVVAQAHGEITAGIEARIAPLKTNWEQIVAGCQAYLELAQQEELRRLLFVEAPAVLAVDTLVEMDQAGFHLLQEAIRKAVEEGVLVAMDAEGFAHLLNGSLGALAAWAAQSSDPQRLAAARSLVTTLLERHRR